MPQATKKKPDTQDKKPIHVLRSRGVKLSIWANPVMIDGRNAVMHKTVIQKIFRKDDGWETTNSLGRDDLPVAIMLMQDAYRFILEAEAKPSKEESEW